MQNYEKLGSKIIPGFRNQPVNFSNSLITYKSNNIYISQRHMQAESHGPYCIYYGAYCIYFEYINQL